MNLLKETETVLQGIGKTPEDIVFIGSHTGEYECSWEEFTKLADFEYDCGYGAPEVPLDLIIAFANGEWLFRLEYDGSEVWSLMPKIPGKRSTPGKKIYRLHVEGGRCDCETLKGLNRA